MNDKEAIKKLKRAIIIRFIFIIFLIVTISSNIEFVSYYLIDNFGDSSILLQKSLVPVALIIELLTYLVGGIVFYLMIKKLLEKEENRRVNELNLIYASLIHDLKTPMTSVQGFSQAIATGKVKEEEIPEICNLIYKKTKSMNELTDTLFEYAKYGIEENTIVYTDIDITVLVRDIVAENYCDFEEKDISIELDIPEFEIQIKGSSKDLKRAFTNLIVNSYKHNPDGTKVKISIEKHEKYCDIIIADTGPQIPDNMDIFSPFVTENTMRTSGQGTGLGLAITKRIIENHRGSIILESGKDEYSKQFRVKLYTKK